MQLATILLALGGNVGNTIPKYEVTPAEVAVLQQIHGNESVTDIDVYPKAVVRTHRAERERLLRNYGRAQPDGSFRAAEVDMLFPGIAARVFETFDELSEDNVPANFFKAGTRQAEADEVESKAVDLSKLKKQQLLTLAEQNNVTVSENDTKAEIIAALQAHAEAKAENDAGGVQDMFE